MKSPDPASVDERSTAEVVQLGAFTLDLRRRGLYRGTERVHLTAKPLETLIALVEHRGATLDKQRLLDLVWGNTAVTEGTLVQAIREIRRVLEDDKEDPVFVQTVPRQGYRFIGRVTTVEEKAPTAAAPAPAQVALPNDETASRAVPEKRWGTGTVVVAAGMAAAVVVVGLWFRPTLDDRGPRPPARLPLTAPLRQITHGMVSAVKPVISPDGKVMLYVSAAADTPGVLDLHVMPVGGGNAWRITENANASGDLPVFWPDGTAVIFSRYRNGEDGSRLPDLWRVPVFGGPIELFLPRASGAGFSPDGREVAYTKYVEGRRPLWVSRVDALEQHREVAATAYVPRWSPDGRWLAYTTSDPEGGLGDLLVVPRAGGPPRQLTDAASQFYGLAWTIDSRAIVAAVKRTGSLLLWQYPLEGGEPQVLLAGVGTYTAPSLSPDGRTLAFCFTRPARDVVVADDLSAPGTRTLTVNESHRSPRLSPSGVRLAAVLEMAGTAPRVYTTDFAGGPLRELGLDAAHDPAWIDDDELAYVVSGPDKRTSLINAIRLSTNRIREVVRTQGDVSSIAFRRGGHDLAFVRQTSAAAWQVAVWDLETSRQRVLLSGGKYAHLRWVPGRDAISWSGPEVAGDPTSNGLWMVDLPEARPRRLLADGFNPVWTADGAALFFSRPRETEDGLWRLELATGASSRLRKWQRVPAFDVAGTRLVYVQDSGPSQIHSVALQ